MKIFSLSCAWSNLLMVNYRIDPAVLVPYLPRQTSLDFYHGECFISIVGFLFLDIYTMGIPWPFHQKFEEFNLRFYVIHNKDDEARRGVVFLKEFVPNSGITWAANTLVREKYRKYPMKHFIYQGPEGLTASYSFKVKEHWNHLSANAKHQEQQIQPGSLEYFMAEHYYAYNKWYCNKTLEIQLKRPPWKFLPICSYDLNCKFEDFYAPQFLPFLSEEPHSVQIFTGSSVKMRLSRIF